MGVFRWSGPIHCKGGEKEKKKMYHIGIDVHKLRCVVAIKGESSPEVLRRTSFANDIDGITGFMDLLDEEDYLPAKVACESTSTYWELPYDTFKDTGIEVLVAHPNHAKMITQTKYKDDKIDAERLAEMSRIGVVPASYIPTKKGRDRRKLTRSRHGLKSSISTYKNRIEAAIATYPLKRPTGDLYSGRGRTWLETSPFREADRMAINANLDIIDTITGQADRLGKVIAKKALNDPDVQKIMTIPGMGHILALTVMAEIVDIGRFATPEKLVSYAGLAPSRHDSGNRTQTGGITKRGSVWLRTAMVEAAFVAVRYDPRLKAIYERIAERRGPMKARVAIARRMLVSIHHMLTEQADYRHQVRDLVKRKLQRIRRVAESPE